MMPLITWFFTFTLFVVANGCVNDENTPPKIISVFPAIEEASAGNQVRFSCTVFDNNSSSLSYKWESTCGIFLGETNKQVVDWKAPFDADECTIKVTVSNQRFSDDYSINVAVVKPSQLDGITIGVYYYPWHGGNDFHGRKYLREHLIPAQVPELGEYNDREEHVIGQHLEWCKYAGINLWVSSWWGPGKMTDVTLKDYILKHPDLNEMKIALFYETSNRIPDFTDTKNVVPDIKYMVQTYFNHPNYYKINGKPVLFIYLTRVLSRKGNLKTVVDLMRKTARDEGFEIYLVGDQVFGQPPSSGDQLALLDAATNYDVYGSTGAKMYATQQKVDQYYQAQAEWRSMAHRVGTAFIPAASPGFNDTGVRDGHIPLSRKLAEDAEFGSLFEAMVKKAVTLVDSQTENLFMITSWNEWHEDTQIEPVKAAPATRRDDSNSETKYTAGLEYEGYELRYLDILREVVGK